MGVHAAIAGIVLLTCVSLAALTGIWLAWVATVAAAFWLAWVSADRVMQHVVNPVDLDEARTRNP